MKAQSLHRHEPTFDGPAGGGAGQAARVLVPSAAGLAAPVRLKPERLVGLPALPWIALATAALALALPVVGWGRMPARAAAADPPASTAMPPAADDDVAFGRFSLRLGGASSADELWRRWSELRQRRLGLLDDVAASVRPAGGAGAGFLLLVGEFRNAAKAAEACGTLRASFLPCEVVHRNGAALKPHA